MTFDGYIRVSRTGGRSGESYLSPTIQRDAITRIAAAKGIALGEVVSEEDISGGKRIDDRELGRLVSKVELGESKGVIVWKLSRFSRNLLDAVEAVTRITNSRGRLLAEDFDSEQPMAKAFLGFLAGFAEEELDARRSVWGESRRRAVERGVHVASRSPTGYRKRDDKRLEPDPVAAPVIRELFARRARGDGWTALARFLDASGIRGPYGNTGWTGAAAAKMIANPVYLGQARSGEIVNDSAHAPLVSRAEWDAAQGTRHVPAPRSGDGLLLTGLVRCAGCRYLVKSDAMRGRNGERLGLYRCRGRHAAGKCEAAANSLARVLEPFVEKVFFDALGPDGPLAEAMQTNAAVERAADEVDEAERELEAYLDAVRAIDVGGDVFARALGHRQEAAAAARAKLVDARQNAALVGSPTPTPGALVEAWPELSIPERRRLLAASVDAVMLRSGRNPMKERVLILWRGQAPEDLPRRGRRVPLAPFVWPEKAPANIRVPVGQHA